MPQIPVNSPNVLNFGFSVVLDVYNRTCTLDTSLLTTYQGGGSSAVLGICFSFQDQDGVELAGIDFTNPQIHPAISPVWILDLSNVNFAFLFQGYKIIGAIKDANGSIYQTIPIYKNVCQPVGITETGYVPGMFQLLPDCSNNVLSVKELTVLVYNNQVPLSVTKTGILSYPTGTINPVNFSSTPFSNNVIYTGEFRINCTTVAQYNLNDDFYVNVTYLTNCPFDVACTDRMGDLMCCIEGVQQTYLKNCENEKGQNAKQLLTDISIPLFLGINKEINGQDASLEAALIRKTLNCDCGVTSLRQNELTPVNPSVYSIVVIGVNGTTVTPSQSGSTKTFTVSSLIFQVVKGNPADTAFSITIDNSVSGVTKYKLTFDYTQLSTTILNTISGNPTLLTQLNSLIVSSGGGNIQGLNGGCVIDLTKSNYTITQLVTNATLVSNIVINGVIHLAPGGLLATNVVGIASWLNSLTLGSFSVSINSLVLLVQSNNNPNTLSTFSFANPTLNVQFSSTNATLVQVLQAIINYLCGISALQVALGSNLSLCYFDYNGVVQSINYTGTGLNPQSQGVFNAGIATSICNIANRINTLSGITCARIQAIFADNPNGSFLSSDRMYGTLGGSCASLTDQQTALMVIGAVNKYANVKTAWCAITCSSPVTCPDISAINISIVSGNIGLYGVTWANTPTANQVVTVRYRVHGFLTWIIATNALNLFPNGNINGTTPYQISGLTAGTNYDVQVQNNCGGIGFISSITTPTGSVFTGSYLLNNSLYAICGGSPVTLYSSVPFASGVTMYTNIGLTTPVTGFVYIAPASGEIFQLNSGTGVVGTDTGSSCNNGTPGTYILGNSTGSICSGSSVTRYTNGAFSVGGTLYIDAGLTTPQTGFSYVVFGGVIYNLNSVNGTIGASTGLSCVTSANLFIGYSQGTWNLNLSSALLFNVSVTGGNVNGYSNGVCTVLSGETDGIGAPIVITAGGTAASQTNNGLTCASPRYIITNTIQVNGNLVHNGSVLVISGVSITIFLGPINCAPYVC